MICAKILKMPEGANEYSLFCASKMWGDPDMNAEANYPMTKVKDDDGEYDYPLTFVFQLNCEDLEAVDKNGELPHEGMFYLFAAVDDFLGYESPIKVEIGLWKRGTVAVRFAKQVNFETFNSIVMTDEEDNPITDPALKLEFSSYMTEGEVANGGPHSGVPELEILPKEAANIGDYLPNAEEFKSLFLLRGGEDSHLALPKNTELRVMLRKTDWQSGAWRNAVAVLLPL